MTTLEWVEAIAKLRGEPVEMVLALYAIRWGDTALNGKEKVFMSDREKMTAWLESHEHAEEAKDCEFVSKMVYYCIHQGNEPQKAFILASEDDECCGL